MLSLKKFKKLPDVPGVYFFKNAVGEVLYIGKATSLRDRVRSYLSQDLADARGPFIVKMMSGTVKVDFAKTDSVLEALILEANLIKKHQPPYNTKEKDDKSFNYVLITKEDFPRVLVRRGREIEMSGNEIKFQAKFGPFTQGSSLVAAMKIVRRIFPFRDKCMPHDGKLISKPCFNRQIGLCPGVCSGEISAREYRATTIKHIKLFFQGKKKTLIKNLEKEMRAYAKAREFEKAAGVKRTIFALQHIQDIALIKETKSWQVAENVIADSRPFRIEAYDIAHLAGRNVVGVMVVVEDGEAKRSDYRKFKIRGLGLGSAVGAIGINHGINDTAALKEVLERRFGHKEWPMPDIVVVDGGKAQINTASRIIDSLNNTVEGKSSKINILSVVKDEHHKPREILDKQNLSRNY